MLHVTHSVAFAHAEPAGAMALDLALSVIAAIAIVLLWVAQRRARHAANLAEERERKLERMFNTVRIAERMAGLGVWQYKPDSDQQIWSEGMRNIFGIDHDESFVDGDAETVLFANDVDLVSSVMLNLEEVEPYRLSFDVVDHVDGRRSLAVQAGNLRREDGSVERVVAVVRDASEEVARERELEMSRALAVCEATKARELASTDPLTGLANRRKVMAELDRLLLRARAMRQPLSLIMFDIDHFKSVNDTFGHVLGDQVLKNVASIAQAQARETDLVGRVGGEEFIWIAPGADEAKAHQLAERLRRAIASYRAPDDDLPVVTASVGCAEMQPGDSTLTLFARVDGALYDAKHAGRNRVRLAA